MLGSQWSKKELENFYKAYCKYGMDWKKVASSVHSRIAEKVAALYNMNKAYLSLPDRVGSIAGFIAMMIDRYNMLDISNSDGGSSEEYEGSKHPKQQSRSNNKLSNANSSDDCYSTMHTRSLQVFGFSPPGKKRTVYDNMAKLRLPSHKGSSVCGRDKHCHILHSVLWYFPI